MGTGSRGHVPRLLVQVGDILVDFNTWVGKLPVNDSVLRRTIEDLPVKTPIEIV